MDIPSGHRVKGPRVMPGSCDNDDLFHTIFTCHSRPCTELVQQRLASCDYPCDDTGTLFALEVPSMRKGPHLSFRLPENGSQSCTIPGSQGSTILGSQDSHSFRDWAPQWWAVSPIGHAVIVWCAPEKQPVIVLYSTWSGEVLGIWDDLAIGSARGENAEATADKLECLETTGGICPDGNFAAILLVGIRAADVCLVDMHGQNAPVVRSLEIVEGLGDSVSISASHTWAPASNMLKILTLTSGNGDGQSLDIHDKVHLYNVPNMVLLYRDQQERLGRLSDMFFFDPSGMGCLVPNEGLLIFPFQPARTIPAGKLDLPGRAHESLVIEHDWGMALGGAFSPCGRLFVAQKAESPTSCLEHWVIPAVNDFSDAPSVFEEFQTSTDSACPGGLRHHACGLVQLARQKALESRFGDARVGLPRVRSDGIISSPEQAQDPFDTPGPSDAFPPNLPLEALHVIVYDIDSRMDFPPLGAPPFDDNLAIDGRGPFSPEARSAAASQESTDSASQSSQPSDSDACVDFPELDVDSSSPSSAAAEAAGSHSSAACTDQMLGMLGTQPCCHADHQDEQNDLQPRSAESEKYCRDAENERCPETTEAQPASDPECPAESAILSVDRGSPDLLKARPDFDSECHAETQFHSQDKECHAERASQSTQITRHTVDAGVDLASLKGGDWGSQIAWHPVLGSHLIYALYNGKGSVHIVDGRKHRLVKSLVLPGWKQESELYRFSHTRISWAPDGRHIAVLNAALYILPV